MTVPTDEKVRRTGDPCLWVLIKALKCGVATSGGEIQLDRSSDIAFKDDFDLAYQLEMFFWYV